jgi:hypothetical protein
LRKTALGFASRPKAEIGALMKAAYGDAFGEADLSPRLAVVAEALNKGDLGRARIAAVQMRLPDLSWDQAIRVARTEESLTKYDPNEPRDRRGRWTNANSGAPAPPPPEPATVTSGPAHLYGGRLIHTGGGGPGDNEPPLDPVPIPEAEPDLPGVRVPEGWDTPGQTIGGLYYPPTRNPTLSNGNPWPRATHDAIKQALAPTSGSKPPVVVIYVPMDKIGPALIGETREEDFRQPSGYSAVRLIGTPQMTYSRDGETGHAADSIQRALAMAETDQFSEIYFNRSLMTSTGGALAYRYRPDVIGIMRPELKNTYVYWPYESLSPGQNLKGRQDIFDNLPGMGPVEGQRYKFSGLVISPYYIILD